MSLSPALLEILACPEDKGPLYYIESESMLFNPRLSKSYEIRNDIPVMLIDEAVTVGRCGAWSTDGHRCRTGDRANVLDETLTEILIDRLKSALAESMKITGGFLILGLAVEF